MVLFQVTLSDPLPKFQGHGIIFRPIDALNILHGQLTRDLFVIAKFLFLVTVGLGHMLFLVHLTSWLMLLR